MIRIGRNPPERNHANRDQSEETATERLLLLLPVVGELDTVSVHVHVLEKVIHRATLR